MIPAEWFGWMHHKTDIPPTQVSGVFGASSLKESFSFKHFLLLLQKPPVKYEWMADHTMNQSGTKDAYTPYSTVKPKVQSWTPPKKT